MNEIDLQYWRNKKKWMAFDAVFVMLGVDPAGYLPRLIYDPNLVGAEASLSEEDSVLLEASKKLLNDLEGTINYETYEKEGDGWGDNYPRYFLNGIRVLNPYRQKKPLELEFPQEAFKTFAEVNVFYGMAIDVPIFRLYHVPEEIYLSNFKNTQDDLTSQPQEVKAGATLPEDEEVIEGVTVGQLRNFLDKSSKEYRPRLEVLIRTIISLVGIPEVRHRTTEFWRDGAGNCWRKKRSVQKLMQPLLSKLPKRTLRRSNESHQNEVRQLEEGHLETRSSEILLIFKILKKGPFFRLLTYSRENPVRFLE